MIEFYKSGKNKNNEKEDSKKQKTINEKDYIISFNENNIINQKERPPQSKES